MSKNIFLLIKFFIICINIYDFLRLYQVVEFIYVGLKFLAKNCCIFYKRITENFSKLCYFDKFDSKKKMLNKKRIRKKLILNKND